MNIDNTHLDITLTNVDYDEYTLEVVTKDRVENQSSIIMIPFVKGPYMGVDMHSNLISRESDPSGQFGQYQKDFYSWSFNLFTEPITITTDGITATVRLSPILIRTNYTWEYYNKYPDEFLSELRYVVNLARSKGGKDKVPLLLDHFLWFTSGNLYSIGGSPDTTPSNPSKGFGFPNKYTAYYANLTGLPEGDINYWKQYNFWQDFLSNNVKDVNGANVNIWDDFIEFQKLIIQETYDVAFAYEWVNEPLMFNYDYTNPTSEYNRTQSDFAKLKNFYRYTYNQLKSKLGNKPVVWGKPLLFGNARRDYYNPEKWKLYVPDDIENAYVSGHVYADPSTDPNSSFYRRNQAYAGAASVIPGIGKGRVLITEHNRPLDPNTSTIITDEMVNGWIQGYKYWRVRGICWYTWRPKLQYSINYTANLTYYDSNTQQRVLTDHGKQWVKFLTTFYRRI